MLPSASLGAEDENGKRRAMYEPVHGSAPDIAGQGKANSLAMIGSLTMALRYSFDMGKEADLVDSAIASVLAKNLRTADIMMDGMEQVSTDGMGDAVIAEMEKAAG